jgi:hypothetical protein
MTSTKSRPDCRPNTRPSSSLSEIGMTSAVDLFGPMPAAVGIDALDARREISHDRN